MVQELGSRQRVLIEFKQVSKWFDSPVGRFIALQNINLQISRGEHVTVVGKSGSGKSTFLNMLTGIDHPSEGQVAINNVPIHTLTESQLASWRGINIGIVFQFFQLIPTLTIQENLLLAMDFVAAIPKHARLERANELLSLVGVDDHIHKLPSALSGGQQQRAAIARALANDPHIIVADEPTGNLDTNTAQAIDEIFLDLSSKGKTVVIVTHDKAMELSATRIITLRDGLLLENKIRAS